MKKMLHKIFSVLLAVCFILSAVPAPAAAAEIPANTTTNGYYNGNDWVEGGNGSTTHNIEGTDVILYKTATPVEGLENTFDITLKVQTSTTTTTHTVGGAVVLVIDTSLSMTQSVSGTDRINAAKVAARNFLASYAGTDATASRQLAIVSFNSGASTVLDWYNVAGGAGKNSYNAALDAINGLGTSRGTNMEAGLSNALSLLNDISASSESVVLLSDGAPTASSSTAGWGNEKHCTAAATQASAIKNTGAKLYTVCFGAARDTAYDNVTVSQFLSGSVASSGCAYDADDASQLNAAFQAISESITSGLDGAGWTATDPMADMISVTGGTSANFSSSDNKNYTWKLANATTSVDGNKTTYTYTYTYTVTLNVQSENFKEGETFPTNEPTYLNVNGKQYAFPVPGVTGVLPRTDVTVTKVWNDNGNQDGKRTDSVTVQLKQGDTLIGEKVTLNASNNWSYTWDGETYNLIAYINGNAVKYTVVEDEVDGYTPSVTASEKNPFALTLTNTLTSPEKVDVDVTKVWNDNNDQDGIRPESITVDLLNGDTVVGTAVLNEDNDWSYTFAGLDKNANGNAINYTVSEPEVPEGYTSEVDGLIITNTHETATTEVSGVKTWVDADNQDGIRPDFITINLFADDVKVDSIVTSEFLGWDWTFTELPKYRDGGVEIIYTITENPVDGYTSEVNGYNVTNTHAVEKTSVTITKIWNDSENQDGKRPTKITVQLLANGAALGEPVIVTGSGDKWTYTFENVDKYSNGQEITYTVKELNVDENYTATESGLTITNTHEVEKTSVKVTKVWDDNSNQDGKRPTKITVQLLANGTALGEPVTVTGSGDEWTYTFENVDKYSNGQEITYTVKELNVDENYTATESGLTITNTHEVEKTSVKVTKVWADNDDQDGIRPKSITVNLMNGTTVAGTAELNEANNWSYTFTGLDKNANGTEIVYTVAEPEVPAGYTSEVDGLTITNTHEVEKTSVTVTKAWNDNENQDGIRPQSVTFELWANDVATGKTLKLTAKDNWTGSFTDLDKNENGEAIVYTIQEQLPEGTKYEQESVTGNAAEGFTVTNAYTPETISISGAKTWEDGENQDGNRPDLIFIRLYANGTEVDSIVTSEFLGWDWTFENLPKYEKGTLITYTITEDAVEGYTTVVDGYDVTNSYTPEETSVSVTKAWSDDNNRDNIRPNDVTVKLLADGEDTGKTLVLNQGNNWSDTFTGLAKNNKGTAIVYTIEEIKVDGYTAVITGDAANGFTVTNTHTIETTEVSGTKTWNDKKNQDGVRPESITVNLKANGQIVDTVVVTETDGWTFKFTNLPKNEAGTAINYTVEEVVPEGYSAEYDGYNITNRYTPKTLNIQVTKAWADANDQDGLRPEKITVKLLANGEDTGKTLKLTAKDNWTGSFENLDKYAEGVEIVYTIEEVQVEGYEKASITGDVKTGFTVTNTHEPETIEVIGKKTWNDNNDQDGKRPASITVKLMANGKVVDTKVVTEEDSWIYSFKDLAKYENGGNEIVYTVVEDAVTGYSATYDGYNITNSYTPESINIKVTKSWVDSNDADGIRPSKVTIYLYANGENTGEKLELTAKDKWTGSFTDLPKYEDGKEIKYTIKEKDVKGYNGVIKGSAANGFTVTNSHNYIPKTGDDRTPILWISMMALGILAVVFATTPFFKKKGKYSR